MVRAFALVLPFSYFTCAQAQTQTVMSAHTLIQTEEQHGSSGTSIEPASTPVPMLMTVRDGWQLMLHANAFAANTQQQADSPRNRDAFFSTNWIMPMAQYAFGSARPDGDGSTGGLLTLRAMLSFEPATIPARNYPELFQQGETAYGAPIVDGQHPHDFFMEVAALYDLHLSKNTLFSVYAAPVGDPAIGPTAYPHRQSASEDPIAALGHHQEDSTHIAFNVVTGGLTYRWVRAELGGFHGAEPEEAHWHFQPSPNGLAMDSVATRITVSPTADWTGQYSVAHIHSPEALYPGEDQNRQTASVMYHHTFHSRPMSPMQGMSGGSMAGMKMSGTGTTGDSMPGMDMPGMDMAGMDMAGMAPSNAPSKSHPAKPMMQMTPEPTMDLSTTALWGRTRSLADNSKENSYLLEALLRFRSRNYVWTRMENAGRSNELLLTPGTPLPPNFTELPIGHVAAYSFGYDHDLPLGPHVLAAPGVQFTEYRTPPALRNSYGRAPTGELFFVRFRLR
ncbi:MAG: hypothetical protein ACRYFU_07380 [Janthinobacterium lividum]